MGRQYQQRGTVRENQQMERDRHTMRKTFSKNHRNIAAQMTAELHILPEDPFSTKTVRRELDKSNIHSRAAVAKPLIRET
jgi:hypothetical protein